jgi:hypothetical protein
MSDPDRPAAEEKEQELNPRNRALLAHPEWKNPPNHNLMLYYIWDFVMRSKYMLSEYDNVKAGRPVQHANQFQQGAGRSLCSSV